ncbi:MAG: cytochrome c maturation protein CcmE [Paracoccaceae bacterium]
MRSSKKTKRIQMLVFGGVLLATASALVGFLAKDGIAFFKSPTELTEGSYGPQQLLRVGGLVVEGSPRTEGPTNIFEVTDTNQTVTVAFTGVLPDLFRENQGIVAEGYWREDQFVASEVLAKHDENYMPKEVTDALKEQGHFRPEGS